MIHSTLKRKFVLALAIGTALALIACGSSVQGTYTNTTGTLTLELRSGGKASFLMMGETQDCTYTVKGKDIHLTCGRNETDFHILDDGSLNSTSPFVGATFGVLKKSK